MPGDPPDFQAGWDLAYKAGYEAGAAAALPDVAEVALGFNQRAMRAIYPQIDWDEYDREVRGAAPDTETLARALHAAECECDYWPGEHQPKWRSRAAAILAELERGRG